MVIVLVSYISGKRSWFFEINMSLLFKSYWESILGLRYQVFMRNNFSKSLVDQGEDCQI